MSTTVPWFRYGFRETKRWLQRMRQKGNPCQGEIVDALERCDNKRKNNIEENYPTDYEAEEEKK